MPFHVIRLDKYVELPQGGGDRLILKAIEGAVKAKEYVKR
jgi:hypothetical protein